MEPITTGLAAAFLYKTLASEGLLGKTFEELFGKNAVKVVERVIHSIRDTLQAGKLPANHDLRRAGVDSFRKAGIVLADALACELDPKLKTGLLWQRFRRWLIDTNRVTDCFSPEMAWVQRLIGALKNDKEQRSFDDTVLQVGPDTTGLLDAQVDAALASELHKQFAVWATQHVDSGRKPAFFEDFLFKGWEVEKGTLTLYQAYCVFFREYIKNDLKVFSIFTGNTLSLIQQQLQELKVNRTVDETKLNEALRQQLVTALDKQLGDLRDWLDEQFAELKNYLGEEFKQVHDEFQALPVRVVDELEERALSRLRVSEIIAREKKNAAQYETAGESIIPADFYTIQSKAYWIGVLRKWDAPRSYHDTLLKTILSPNSLHRVGAITGSGGSGKSVSLRRLAVDLATQDIPAWWVGSADYHTLLDHGLQQLRDTPLNYRHVLLIDKAEQYTADECNRILDAILDNPHLSVVLAGRRIRGNFRDRLQTGVNLFHADGAADVVPVFQYIAGILPEWKEAIQGLLATQGQQPVNLVHALTVLARTGVLPSNVVELEARFVEIVTDDVRRIGETYSSVEKAIIEVAAIRDAGGWVSFETFVALAARNPGDEQVRDLFAEPDGNPRWKMLRSLLDYETHPGFVCFHHDDYLSAILKAATNGEFQGGPIGDPSWYREVLSNVVFEDLVRRRF